MAYDVELADRIRELLVAEPGHAEKAMFGGLAFLVGGHIAVAASSRGGLMLRVPEADAGPLLADPHVSPMVMSGREMKDWLRVEAEALSTDDELGRWVERGVAQARALPPAD